MKILYWCPLKTEEQGTMNPTGLDGHQVSLNVQKAELEKFKGGKSEGFREVK
jgi:hypothetical protein